MRGLSLPHIRIENKATFYYPSQRIVVIPSPIIQFQSPQIENHESIPPSQKPNTSTYFIPISAFAPGSLDT